MKHKIALVLAALFLTSALAAGAYSTKLKLFFNGNQVETELSPRIVDEHLYLPVEILEEQLGLTVHWDKEQGTVEVDGTDGTVLTAQIQRLEEFFVPEEPRAAVETWAEGVKRRNGAWQYAVMASALKKEAYEEFAALNWSTGTSSPWVESYLVTESFRTDGEKYRYTVEFKYTDATGNATYAKTYVTVEREGQKWVVSALETVEVNGKITEVTLDAENKVKAVFVAGEKSLFGGYDQANVLITPKTRIYQGFTDQVLTTAALSKGVAVEVAFTADPRLMIYPVTAEAKSIRVFTPEETAKIVYANTAYGFTLHLPTGWQDFQVLNEEWEGLSLGAEEEGKTAARGLLLKIRHPEWTPEEPRQDIPIMVFTLDQWADLQGMKFSVGAAPVGPQELGRNEKYVFALPARYNYAFPVGYEEVEAILAGNPLTPVTPGK
ncbi:MAG: hypothetical protein GX202_03235 [Firmicutes bacterium]|nr:hypothetical protein [Bacillota bacterium]